MTNEQIEALKLLAKDAEWYEQAGVLLGESDTITHVIQAADAIRQAIADSEAQGWQTIETATKDGRRVLLWHKWWDAPHAGCYYGDVKGWGLTQGTFADQPTHWMHLPQPPQQEG